MVPRRRSGRGGGVRGTVVINYSGCHHGEAMVESPLKLLATLEAYMYMLSTYIMLLLSASEIPIVCT